MLRDVRFGIRILRRHPSYAFAAIAVMALGVGATTAVFSVLRGVLITPLPYREPSRLVTSPTRFGTSIDRHEWFTVQSRPSTGLNGSRNLSSIA